MKKVPSPRGDELAALRESARGIHSTLARATRSGGRDQVTIEFYRERERERDRESDRYSLTLTLLEARYGEEDARELPLSRGSRSRSRSQLRAVAARRYDRARSCMFGALRILGRVRRRSREDPRARSIASSLAYVGHRIKAVLSTRVFGECGLTLCNTHLRAPLNRRLRDRTLREARRARVESA